MQPTTSAPQGWLERLLPIIETHGPSRAAHVPQRLHDRRLRRAAERLAEVADGLDPAEHGDRLDTLARRWAEAGLPDDDEGVLRFEIERIEARELREAAEADKPAVRIAHARRQVSETHGRVELRGLQTSSRVRVPLSAVYVPLRAHDARPIDPAKLAAALPDDLAGESRQALLDNLAHMPRPAQPVPDLLTALPRLLLSGGPGAGKSTLVAHLACADAVGEARLPIVVLARALTEPRFDVALLAESADLPEADVSALLEQGAVRLYLDGLDELRPALRQPITAAVAAFAERWLAVPMVLTSRPRADAEGSPWPAGFVEARVAGLTDDDVAQCVQRWCAAAERSVQTDAELAEAAAARTADELMQAIRGSRAIQALAETPLMCTVLCIVHRFSARIPQRRAALYEACTNVLLFEWDRAKFAADAVIGRLDAPAQRQLLGALARRMMERGEVEVDRAAVEAAFAERLPALGQSADDAARLVDEIRDRSGVLMQRSEGRYGFSHLAFQEYLCATELMRAGDYAALIARVNDEAWTEVFALAVGLPTSNAARIVELLIASEGDAPPGRATLLAAMCVESAVQMPVRLREVVQARVEALISQEDRVDLLRQRGLLAALWPTLALMVVRLVEREDVPLGHLSLAVIWLALGPRESAAAGLRRVAALDATYGPRYAKLAKFAKMLAVALSLDEGRLTDGHLGEIPESAEITFEYPDRLLEVARAFGEFTVQQSSVHAPKPDAPTD